MTLVLSGWFLVLASWSLLVGALVLVGAPLSGLTHRDRISPQDFRRGLWWGLAVYAIFVMLVSPFTPLASPIVAWLAALLPIVGAIALTVMVCKRGWRRELRLSRTGWLLTGSLAVAVLYLALAALGPVTNYDTGLYHLGAITYAEMYSTIPGLANVYFPLGYSSVEFPLAALLSNGPWSGNGFRLLNGLFLVALAIDLLIRWNSKNRGADAFVVLVSVGAVYVPMVALADYWVTSPSQDSPVFVLTVVSVGLLVRAATSRHQWASEIAAAVAVSTLLVLMRPTVLIFVVGVVLVSGVLWKWRTSERRETGACAKNLILSVVALGAGTMAWRDYLLSGWLLYPLSFVAFDVDWLSPDPASFRLATLGFHRDANDLWVAADGWSWILPWILRLPDQWEFWLLILMTVSLTVLAVAVKRAGVRLRVRMLLLLMVPSAVGIVFWFFLAPPSFRFAWGVVFTLFTIPIGWLMWRLSASPSNLQSSTWNLVMVLAFATLIVAVTLYTALFRFDATSVSERKLWVAGIEVPYAVSPVFVPETQPYFVSDSLVVQVPITGDQCWSVFPLCVGQLPEPLERRSGTIQDGFRQMLDR